MDTENQLIFEQNGALGIISLNRVASLNALSLEMIEGICNQLEHWQHDASVQAILIQSNSPKAFCAGGDIRYLYDCYKNGTPDYRGYFIAEYHMLNAIRDYAKPVICLLDGYVLGGGFGLAQACHIVISSEKSRFAMPETAIGFFPDVGATYVLSRLDDIGVYMALTGEQISSSDALYLDLIDYHVPSEQFAALQEALSNAAELSKASIEHIVFRLITSPVESELKHLSATISKHFAFRSVADIEHSLANEQDEQHKAWANKILAILQQRSPVATQTSLKLQYAGRGLSLQQCMQLERDVQDIWFEHGDFIEGVRALMIDKDKQPKWQTQNVELERILDKLGV